MADDVARVVACSSPVRRLRLAKPKRSQSAISLTCPHTLNVDSAALPKPAKEGSHNSSTIDIAFQHSYVGRQIVWLVTQELAPV